MLKEIDQKFSDLEKTILDLQNKLKHLSENHTQLSEEYTVLKEKYEEEKKNNKVLVEDNKNIKLHSAIAGNPEHNKLMKKHINRLIKEVDFCISQIQNSGL